MACQTQRRPGGEKESKREEMRRQKRKGGVENRKGLEGVRGIDFKDEGRVCAGRMKQMHVGQEQEG